MIRHLICWTSLASLTRFIQHPAGSSRGRRAEVIEPRVEPRTNFAGKKILGGRVECFIRGGGEDCCGNWDNFNRQFDQAPQPPLHTGILEGGLTHS